MFERFKRRPGGAEMFERFTDRARRVIVLAQEEARQLNHNYVGTEHILLGLIREGDGVAVQVLVRRGIDIDLDRVRQQVIQGLHGLPGDVPPTGGAAFDEGEKTIAARETEQAADGGEIRLLRGEIERLRALLRAHDIDPGTGHVD